MDSFRFDFAFSYWIFAWFIFYYYKIVPYSPKIWLIMAIIENLWLLFLMFLILTKVLLFNLKLIYFKFLPKFSGIV